MLTLNAEGLHFVLMDVELEAHMGSIQAHRVSGKPGFCFWLLSVESRRPGRPSGIQSREVGDKTEV